MATIIAINQQSNHIFLSRIGMLNLAHSSPLPWIFDSIGEDYIVSCDIKSSVFLNIKIYSRFSYIAEDRFTIRNPIRSINQRGSQRMFWVRNLEPSKFCTILPSPLTHIVLTIHFNFWERNPIILIECNSFLISILLEYWKLEAHFILRNACENIAKLCSSSVLNTESKCISDIEHEISIINSFASKDSVN